MARIIGYAQAEIEPKWLFLAPVKGVQKLLARIEMPIEAFDLIEINEAFAAQTARRRPRTRLRLVEGQRQRRGDRARPSRSAHRARASLPRCSTSSIAGTDVTGSRRSASAAAAPWRWHSNASDHSTTPANLALDGNIEGDFLSGWSRARS